MKKRILTLALALVLVFSVFSLPVHAASGKDVHAYMKSIAMEGSYSSEDQVWYNGFQIGSNGSGSFYFAINYLEQTKYIQNSIVYYANDDNYLSWEVTWKISSNPSPSYNAFVEVYDAANSANDTKGTIVLPASYKGGTISSFDRGFTGNTAYKSVMLEILNNFLPGVLEYTRAVINENDFALADLGMTGYKKCDWIHAYDKGTVTQEPTCVDKGTKTYTCRVCGDAATEDIDPTGVHTWDDGTVVTPATCTEPGLLRYACTVCGTAGAEETIPALGHAWNGGETVQAPGCEIEGLKRWTCTRCAETREEALPALGHLWSFTEVLEEDEEGGFHACTGLYTCTRCNETKEARLCAAEVFTDMPAEGNWAHAPIDWAYFNHITSGKTPTTFAPKDTVTRAEAMTFLWKTLDSPEPETTENPFADVKEGKYYYKPVLWAVENGITSGTSETTFGPKDPCTRAQILTFIWTAAGRPEPETTENPFTDVKEGKYYYKAVLWGVENQITSGVAPDQFGTNNTCTRAQIVAFLYKAKDLMHQEPAPQPDPGFVEWRWFPNNTVMDRNDLGIGSVEHIWIAVRGDQVPELRTDNAEVAQLNFLGIFETPNGFPEDCFLYDCEVTVIGEGTAQIRCFLGDNMVGELTIDCEHLAFRDAYWFGDDGLAVEEEEITLEDGEEAHLGVVMHYSQVISGEAGMDPTAWEQPTIYTDAPERLSLVLTETKPPYYVTPYDRGFLWHGTVSGAGPIHVYIELNGEIVKTLIVQVP